MKQLELYQTKWCPYCRVVRQKLAELGLPFLSHNTNDPEILKQQILIGGKDQVPMLVDPDQNVIMYESADIVEYLEKRYASKG